MVKQPPMIQRLALPFVKWWCRYYRTPGFTSSYLVARANRELRYERLNRHAGRHQHPWSDATQDVNEVVILRTAKHRAGELPTQQEQVELYRSCIPLMLAY